MRTQGRLQLQVSITGMLRWFFRFHSIVKRFNLNNRNWIDERGISGTPRETITKTDIPADVGIESAESTVCMACDNAP